MTEPARGRWAIECDDGCSRIEVDAAIYTESVVSRAAHDLTGVAFILVESRAPGRLVVSIRPKEDSTDRTTLVGEFSNLLLDYKLRSEIGEQTAKIRELIVAQAFVEADLLDRDDSNAPLATDPRQLTRRR